jgi:hypothetical protein
MDSIDNLSGLTRRLFPVNHNKVILPGILAKNRLLPVDKDSSLCDQPVRLAPGTDAMHAQILIQSHLFFSCKPVSSSS